MGNVYFVPALILALTQPGGLQIKAGGGCVTPTFGPLTQVNVGRLMVFGSFGYSRGVSLWGVSYYTPLSFVTVPG